MKFKTAILATVAAGSLATVGSLFAGDVTPSSVDARIAEVRTSLTSTRLIEAPDKAARLVWQTPAKLRGDVAKAAVDYAKGNEKLKILGGSIGESKLDSKGVEALSKLPSLNELRATLLALLQTPATRIAGVLQAPGGQVARVISAYSKKGEAA